MARVAACAYHGEPHAALLHAGQRKLVEFCTDALVLVVGMHGEQLHFAGFVLEIEFVDHESDGAAIDFGHIHERVCALGAVGLDYFLLLRLPVRIDAEINGGSQRLAERSKHRFPGEQ